MPRIRKPGPAMVVALVALTVALSGSAVAAGIVPLAKRALSADNAKHALVADSARKLGTQTAAQIAAQAAQAPGPASTAAGLVVVKTAGWTNSPGQEQNDTVTCDAGQKAIGGGWADPGDWSQTYQTFPTTDGTGWTRQVYTFSNAPGTQSGTLYAVCLK